MPMNIYPEIDTILGINKMKQSMNKFQQTSIKLLVTDMDGTLLDLDHQVSPENRRAVARCLQAGIEVVLASGRSFFSVRPQALDLGLSGPQISLNGGMVADASTGKLHSLRTMDPPLVETVVKKLEGLNFCPIIFAGSGIFSAQKGPATDLIESFGEPPITIVSRRDLEHIPDPVKVLIHSERSPLDEDLAREFGPEVLTIRTGALFLEFQTPGVSKGAALQVLMDERKLRPDQVIALGDNDNDVSLFETAHWSFAVANATAAARKSARFLTVAHTDHAVAQVVESLFTGVIPSI